MPNPADTETLAEVLAAHFPNVVVEPNGAVRAKCEGAGCDWFVLRNTPRVYRNWRVVIRLHSAHLARIVQARAGEGALREAWAEVKRDHTMPPNKDRHGYDYRMGWWDAVVYADRLIQRRIRAALTTADPS